MFKEVFAHQKFHLRERVPKLRIYFQFDEMWVCFDVVWFD
jgi:hypothetical protein